MPGIIQAPEVVTASAYLDSVRHSGQPRGEHCARADAQFIGSDLAAIRREYADTHPEIHGPTIPPGFLARSPAMKRADDLAWWEMDRVRGERRANW